MQVKTRIVSFGLVAVVAACATGSKFRWPEANPFSGVAHKSLAEASEGREPLRLVFASNVMGEVEPCGCAVGPKGGLDRRLTFIENEVVAQAKQWPYVIADAGNALLPTPRVDEARESSYREVARLLLKAHKDMGVMVQNVGYLDLGFGVDYLKQIASDAGLPLISASWTGADGKLLFPAAHSVKVSDTMTVTFVGLSAGLDGELSEMKLSVLDAKKSLKEALSSIPEGHVVVVLSDLGQPKDEELAREFSSRSLVFVGSRDMGGVSLPKQVARSLLVQGQFRGQQWGLVDAMVKPKSKGWVFLEKMADFEVLWSNLVSRRDADRAALKDSSELKIEETRHSQAGSDLMSYAPSDYADKSVYRYHLEDLGDKYRKKNKLSETMRKMVQLKQ